jgi:hypothetical protein
MRTSYCEINKKVESPDVQIGVEEISKCLNVEYFNERVAYWFHSRYREGLCSLDDILLNCHEQIFVYNIIFEFRTEFNKS